MARRKKHKVGKSKGLGRKGGIQSAAGESKKPGPIPRVAATHSREELAEAQDHKRNNIGNSGQGTQRGRERRLRESAHPDRIRRDQARARRSP